MSILNHGNASGAADARGGNGTDPLTTQRGRGALHADADGRSEFGDFLDDLSELARGAGGHGDLRGEIERRVSQARGRMDDALEEGVEMGHRARREMRRQMHRGLDYSRDTVTERPLSAMTAAAIGGLIVGLLLTRRH
jgi:ElaB/YqjD/DUF883 family membrane-anchored ribosome-binding protein